MEVSEESTRDAQKNIQEQKYKQKLIENNQKTQKNLKKLYISIAICVCFMTAELIGGIISGSLAILTDAAHILSDILGFGISVVSIHIARLPASRKMTFGFHRAEVVGALFSIVVIWALTVWLLSEAIYRMIHASDVAGGVMVITAVAGLAGNIIMAIVIGHDHSHFGQPHSHDDHSHHHHGDHSHRHHENHSHHHEENLNMRAAFLHVLGDGLQSIGVIIAGCIIYYYPEHTIADPICTLVFSVIVMCTTIPIVVSCVSILMEASPKNLNSAKIKADLNEIENVVGVHDLHVWCLSSEKVLLACHLVCRNPENCLQKACEMLKDKYRILHATIQIELEDEQNEFDCLGLDMLDE